MIVSELYKTDIDYSFWSVSISLTFSSETIFNLDYLIENEYLPVELSSIYKQVSSRNYKTCDAKGIDKRKLNVVANNINFTIDCALPFREIDLTALIERDLQIITIGETIKNYTMDNLVDKNYG